jgi:hypothetical protein
MTDEWSSMKDEQADVADVAAATQRRPDFCAEALSPAIRIGLLFVALIAAGLLFFVVLALGIWPERGMLAIGEFAGVMTVGLWIGLTFITFLVYGALLANNPRLNRGERVFWYTMFALAGPVTLPVYWFKEVWPVKYEPIIDERLAPARNPLPPYSREENETRVLAHP